MISIIIPFYNVQRYLDNCIRSVCGQTYTDIEVLLIDDGSTDDSKYICQEWIKKDKRIQYVYQDNQGVSAARNNGLERARGDYIGFVDGDDWIEPMMYERLLDAIILNKADVSMCGFEKVYETGEHKPCTADCGGVFDFEGAINICLRSKRHNGGYFTSVWNKLFKKKVVKRNEIEWRFDSTLSVGEDEVWLFSILHSANRVAAMPEILYHYAVRSNSAIDIKNTSMKYNKHLRDAVRSKEICLNNSKRWGVSNELLNLIEARTYYHASKFYQRCKIYENISDKTDLLDVINKCQKSFLISDNYTIRTKVYTLAQNLVRKFANNTVLVHYE